MGLTLFNTILFLKTTFRLNVALEIKPGTLYPIILLERIICSSVTLTYHDELDKSTVVPDHIYLYSLKLVILLVIFVRPSSRVSSNFNSTADGARIVTCNVG